MTTTVKVYAHCASDKEVRIALTNENGPSETVLKDGESHEVVVYDDHKVEVREREILKKARDMSGVFPILKFFVYDHLPPHLQKIYKPFGDLAFKMAQDAKDYDEMGFSLRHLLEAKDSAVRACLS